MGGTMTGGQRTATSRQMQDGGTLTRLRRHYRGSTALSNRALFWGAPLVGAALLSAVPAAGNPTGGSVVGGGATISGEGTANVTVNQTTDRAILHWDDFSIDAGETTQFIQPGSGSIAVNRVTGTAQSLLLGTLTANGNVWIINPNGLLAGAGSIIDVNGFLASTADILDSDILDGDNRFSFDIPSLNPDASIVNLGEISVGERGLAALVAPGVENDGIIAGRMAQVVLGGAETFALDFAGDGLLSFEVASPVTSAADGMTDLVTNSGLIDAPGGIVLLTAESIDGVVDNVINMSGVIRAESLTTANGQVILSGGDQGIVRVAGTIDASGTGAGETGGEVNVLGHLISLDLGTNIDASGDAGGGTVLVGGDIQGAGDTQTAWRTAVAPDASIDVSATGSGDGGTAVIWADDYTMFRGSISARGGSQAGDGGFVEVSGAQSLTFDGAVDASAANGSVGTLLLDPLNVTIVDQSFVGPTDDGQITDNNTILGGESPGAEFTIREDVLESLPANVDVIIEATNSIFIEELTTDGTLAFQADGSGTGGAGSVTFTANSDGTGGGSFVFRETDNTISTQGGDLTITGRSLTLGNLDTGTGSIELVSTATIAAGDITLNGVNAGALDVTAGRDLLQGTGSIAVTGTADFDARNITLETATNSFGNSVSMTATDSASLADSTQTVLGDVSVTNDLVLDLGAGATQSAGTSIAAQGVLVQAVGDVVLSGSNEIATLAASVTGSGSDFAITEGVDGFTVGSVSNSAGTVTVDGVTTNDGNVTLNSGANTLVLSQDIAAGSGVISGDATSVNVTSPTASIQDGAAVAATGGTVTVAAGTYTETVVVDNGVTLVGAQAATSAVGRTGASETIVDGGFQLLANADNVTIDGFTIQNGVAGVGGENFGVFVGNGASNVTVEDTIFSRSSPVGDGFRGIVTTANGGNTDLVFTRNSFSGWATGIFLNPGATGAQVTDSAFDTNFVGMSVDGPDGTVITGNTFADNVFEGLGIGPDWSDPAQALTLTLTGNDFSGTETLIALYTDITVDATSNTLDGTALSDLTINELLALEDQIDHGIDDPAGGFDGFVITRANNVFVTTNSGSIQRGVDRAALGDTVNVGGGTYAGDLTIGSDVVFNFVGGVVVDSVIANAAVEFGGVLGTSGGDLVFNDAVTLTGNTTLTTDVSGGNDDAGDVTFASTVDGPFDLKIDATADGTGAGGAVALNDVGSAMPVSSLDVDGGTVTFGGTISTGGPIEVTSDESITVNQVLATTGTDSITLDAAVNVLVQNTIDTEAGDIGISAGNAVTFNAVGDVTSVSGNITVTADSDGDANGSGGAITMADGTLISAGSGTITMSADESITLGGLLTTSTDAAAVSLTSASGGIVDGGDTLIDVVAAGGGLDIVSGTDVGVGTLGAIETTIASLAAASTIAGDIVVNESDTITLGAGGSGISTTASDIIVTSGGTITVDQELNARSNGNVTLTATSGDIAVNANVLSTALAIGNAGDGTGTLKLDSNLGEITTNGSGTLRATAGAADLDAATGIVAATEVAGLSADTDSGTIDIDNALASAVIVSSLTTGTGLAGDSGDILFDQTGGTVSFTSVTTNTASAVDGDGDIVLTNTGGDLTVGGTVTAGGAGDVSLTTTSSGNIVLTGTTTAADNTVTVASADSISGAGTVTANTVTLTGVNGIEASTAASSISAVSTTGTIDIDNVLGSAVTVTNLLTGTNQAGDSGDILFDQTGGTVSFTSVTTDTASAVDGDGDIVLTNTGGDLTVGGTVTAGGAGDVSLTTTSSGNIVLTGTTTAADNTVTVASADSISGAGTVTANTVTLTGVNGIEASTAASSISAVSTTGTIDIDNVLGAAVTVTNLLTGTNQAGDAGDILFDQTGGTVSFTSVTTNTASAVDGDGDIVLTNTGGDLTVGGTVTAGGAGDVSLTTTSSGNIVLTGTTTAADNTVTVASADSISGAGTVTANTVTLTGVNGIEASTAASSISAVSTTGTIDIDNVLGAAVTVTNLLTGTNQAGDSGDILFDQTGGTVSFTSVTTNTASAVDGDGDIVLTNTGGDLTVGGTVTAGGAGDATLTSDTGQVTVNGAVSAVGDDIVLQGNGVTIADAVEVDAGSGNIAVDAGTGQFSTQGTAALVSTGSIDLLAETIDLSTASRVGGNSAGTGQAASVVLRSNSGTTIGVGDDANGTFDLDELELNIIQAANLRIGDGSSGTLDVGDWTLAGTIGGVGPGTGNVVLQSGDGITQLGGALNFAVNDTGLVVRSTGDVALNGSNNLDNVAASVTSGSFSFSNTDDLTVANLTDDLGVAVNGVSASSDVALTVLNDEARLTNATTIESTGGNVTVLADEMTLDTAGTISGNIVTLAPVITVADTDGIDIGSAAVNGIADTLELSIVELGTVDAPILRVGSTDAGDIAITAAVTEAGPPAVDIPDTLSLLTGGTVTQTAAITVDDLNLNIVADEVSLTEANDIGTLSVNTSGATGGVGSTGSIAFVNDDVGDDADLIIGAADTGTGIVSDGAVTLTSDGLTIDNAITAGGQTVTLLPFGTDQTIGIAAAGDLSISEGELNNITAARLVIGNAANTTDVNTGTITADATSGIGRIDINNSGNLTFGGSVNGSFDLFMNTGGNILFNSTFGTPGTPLDLMWFTAGGDVTLAADPIGGARYFANTFVIDIDGNFTSLQFNPTTTTFEPVNVGSLFVLDANQVRLFGSIDGDSTTSAAPRGFAIGGQNADWLFNGCVIQGNSCFDIPLILPVSGLDLSLDDERLLREPLEEEEEEFEDLLSNTGNEELW